MNLKLPALVLVLILSIFLATPIAGQQKRQTPAKTPAKTPAAPAPTPPTFETLLPADSYKIYGEVRGVGQLIRSNAINDVLEPLAKLGTPPKEFKSFVEWLNTHADEVMTSRMLVAAWPTLKEVPEVLIAVEFASPEEAAKFEPQFKEFLPKVLPPSAPESSKKTPDEAEKPKPEGPPKPNYYLQRTGSLILLTPKPLDLKKLKPIGGKLLSQDPNFRVARNRFSSEPLFVFIDFNGIKKEREELQKQYEAESKRAEEEQERARAEAQKKGIEQSGEAEAGEESTDEERMAALQAEQAMLQNQSTEPPKEAPTPDVMSGALSILASSFFRAESDWPDAIGLALSLENDSFDVRALIVNAPGEKSDVVPFVPMLIPGPSIAPEAPNILPADTQLLVTMSLDFPQIHAEMLKPNPMLLFVANDGDNTLRPMENETPFGAIERQLKIKIKDDLLPLLGSEIALSLPITDMGVLWTPASPAPQPQTKDNPAEQRAAPKGPVVAISLKDKEGAKLLLPKLVEAMGMKGALSLAQTERREDTELVSFANVFAYAFVGNFLVISGDAATTRGVVDSYLKHETLSGDSHFKNYTRWQPRQLQGQVYVSPALMESYKSWADSSNAMLSDQAKAFIARLSAVAQPLTYSLSNDGLGSLHELHIPKNLVLLAVAGMAGETNPPPMLRNERATMSALWMISQAQERYKSEKKSGYGSLEQLIAEDMVATEMIENHGYKFDVTVTADAFEVSAVPIEYGKSGKLSFFIDQTGVLRGGDHSGAAASVADEPIR